VIPFSSGRAPRGRIEDGGTPAGSAWLCAARHRMGEARGGGARARRRLSHAAFIGARAEVAARLGDRRRHAVLAMAGLARRASAGQAAGPGQT
jgi:hypothetical protein